MLNDKDYQKYCLAIKPLNPDDPPECNESMVYSVVNTILGSPG